VPTITDIAKRAGVSISTVSYALSGRRPISEATRKRIFAAIEELDFRPNPVGRALASKRSQTIAILHPTRSHVMSEMPLEFLISAASAAARRNYSLLLATSPNEDEELVRLIGQGFIDGLILMEVKLDDARIPLLRQHGYHFSMIGHCRDNDGLSFVDFDFEHGLGLAVDYLTELGHPQVALVSRQQSLHDAGYGPSVRAIEGLHKAAEARGIEAIVRFSEQDPIGGYETARELLENHPRLGAIVTINSEVIGGIMRAVHEAGLRIPDDISFIAITSPRIATLINPPLSTVDFPAEEMGRIGAELLIDCLEGGEPVQTQYLLRSRLTVRGSSGPYTRTGRPR